MASVLFCSTSATLRMKPTYVKTLDHRQSKRVLKSLCALTTIPFPKCCRKIHMVPFNLYYGRRVGTFAMDSSLEVGTELEDRFMISGVSTPNYHDGPNNLEGQLQELFVEIKNMINLGKKDEAVNLLQANYEVVKEQVDLGTCGITEAAVLDVVLLGYVAIGDLRTIRSLIDMLRNIVSGLKDEEYLLDSILMHMGSMYAKLENFELSICVYRRSLQIMERKYGKESSFLCTPLLGMAKVLGASGKVTDAIKIYHQVIKLIESCKGEDNEGLIVPLSALSNLLIKEGKTSDAECQLDRVLNIYKRSYGEKDGRVGMAMCSLAQVKCAKGNVNEAIDLYKSAIQALQDSKGMALDDEVMERIRIDLAELLHAVGRGQEGRALLEESLLITEKLKGKEHPDLVPNLVNLATSYSRSKNFAEAERLLRISLQIIMKAVPPDDPCITFPMLHLAVTLYNLHRDEEAERLALDVLHIREKSFGKESLPVGEALDCLVSIHTRLEKDSSELVDLLKRVLKIQERTFGHDSEQVVETLKKLIYYLDKMGMKNKIYPLQRRLSKLRNKFRQMAIY